MPISPYSGQIYSGYSVGRPYAGAATTSYLTGNVAPGYKISNSSSSSALRANPVRKPGILSGNTTALKKTFSDAEVSGLSGNSNVSYLGSSDSVRRFNGLLPSNSGSRRDINDNNTDRGYNPSWRTNLGGIKENEKKTNTSKPNLTKYGTYFQPPADDAKRPKDIDASKINFSGKPTFSNTSGDIRGRDGDNSSISRNRQVVRLTIKRDKDKNKKPVVVPENSVKSIAQKLFEKYTINEKKNQEPPSYLYRQKKLVTDSSKPDIPKIIDKFPKLPLPPKLSPVATSPKRKSEKDGNEGDDELSEDESVSVKSDKDAAAKCYLRATNATCVKKELEDPQDVKDAIVAAILHPGIDIESDEEIRQLVAEGSDRESSNSSKKKRKSKKAKLDARLLDRRKKSDAEIGGDLLVDKLKRYVKHQVSIKKDSLKNHSRRNSKENKKEETEVYKCGLEFNVQNENKPRERIIPIILQDDSVTDITGLSENELKKSDTSENSNNLKSSSNSKLERSIRSREESERNESAKSASKVSLLLSEEDNTIKWEEKSLCKSFEPVYQTTNVSASEAFPGPFQISFQVSGEHSITHPENKVPATSSFITDSVSDWMETGKKILSLDSNDVQGKKEIEKDSKAKDLPKNIKNKEPIINDYKSELDEKKGKIRDEFRSKLDNSITGKSSSLERKEKGEIFYSMELKSDYTTSKEETRKEFKEGKIESRKPNAERETAIIHSEDDPKELNRTLDSSISDIKDKRGNNFERKFDKGEIRANQDEEVEHYLVKGIPINSISKVAEDKCMIEKEVCKTQDENNGNLILEESSSDKHSLAKSKKLFFQSLAIQKKEENIEDGESKKFDLKKSATTQNVKENTLGYQISPKPFNDAESLDQDLEIKPSLRQFLEQAKNDMKNDFENEALKESEKDSNKLSLAVPEPQIVQCKSEEGSKKALKRPRQILPNSPLEKSSTDNILNARNILKRPVKPKEDLSIQPEKDIQTEDSRPKKKVWRRPPPPKEPEPPQELFKAISGLRRPGMKIGSSNALNNLQNDNKLSGKLRLFETKSQTNLSEKSEKIDTTNKCSGKINKIDDGVKSIKSLSKGESSVKEANVAKQEEKLDTISGTSLKSKYKEISQTKDDTKQDVTSNSEQKSEAKLSKKVETTDSISEQKPDSKSGLVKSYLKNVQKPEQKSKPKVEPKYQIRKQTDSSTAISCSTANQSQESSSSTANQRHYFDEEVGSSTLSTSQSADSAYGSSPSTPQPRGIHLTSKKISEESAENKKSEEEKRKEEIDSKEKTETCEMCGTNCHKKCEKQMANLCGVNQKLLAEALSSVKKGSSSEGKDAFKILSTSTSSASKSASSVSSTETETTTTDDEETETDTDTSEYNGPAEIRSPIQTRPKYKKYNIEDFNFIKVLGKGSFGKVMLAQQVNTENYFAVKCLKKDVVLEDNDVECCLIERKVLTLGTKHPYLCHLFCSFQTPSHLFFVMEYLTGGDLMFHIQRVGRFDEYRACFYGAEIVSGLKFLHNKGIIYRDLKLDNILLDYEGHIRIADFGMCKLQIYLDRFADTFCGTPDYMAPEVIKGLHYNQCVDWWSFGVLLYEMMVGKSPFKGCDEDHLFWLICNEEPFYPRFLSREAQSLLKQLLDKDATRRIGPPYSANGEIKCHQFFKYIDWSKIDSKEMVTPYKPRLRHILDVQYFDRSFTKRNAALTPLDDSILESMDQTPFRDFSYTNPNITD